MSQLIYDFLVEKKKGATTLTWGDRDKHTSGILYITRQAGKELHCFSIMLRQLLQIVRAICYYFIY